MPDRFEPDEDVAFQRTLKAAIGCVGVGLHSGQRVTLTLRPAEPETGIVFRRTDRGCDIPARFDYVIDTRLSTVLGAPDDAAARIGTVEHLMAALAAAGIDNAVVELDGPEVPVLDGSAAPFLFLIDCAGIAVQDAPRRVVEVRRTVRVEDGEAFAELRPAGADGGFALAVSIDFAAPAIGRQALSLPLSAGSFRQEIAGARTFALAAEVESLRAAGFARGGSLGNAVVVEGARVLNPEGLRMRDEFVRHKLLDAVGDLALAGAVLRGRLVAHRPGHTLNNRLLRALFADAGAWREVVAHPGVRVPALAGWSAVPAAA
jgi:UDP-3-O-[3-hydroxymyristoyl] N-acetylglucosamine deacetylase